MSKAAWEFGGFSKPNSTQVPDQLFDELLHVLSGNELKVVMYVARRTFGFKKDSDNISLSQMLGGIVKMDGERLDHGVGLSKPTLLKVLRSLTEKKVLITQRRSSRQKGDMATNYQLHFAGSAHASPPPPPTKINGSRGGKKLDHPLVKEFDHGGVKDFDQALVKPFDHTRNSRQQTVDNTRRSRRVSPSTSRTDATAALVEYFHTRFATDQEPVVKEFKQAADLIAEHGEAKARWIVDFALQKASETNFRPKHLGSVFSYIPGALSAFQGHRKNELGRAQREREEREREEQRLAERATYDALPPEEKVERDLERWRLMFAALHRKREPTHDEVAEKRHELELEHGVATSGQARAMTA